MHILKPPKSRGYKNIFYAAPLIDYKKISQKLSFVTGRFSLLKYAEYD